MAINSITFDRVVEDIQSLSLPEKEELKSLLEKYLLEERRDEIVRYYKKSKKEHQKGQLQFSNEISKLKEILV